MRKDTRYSNVRSKITTKEITEFNQVYEAVPSSVIANDLGINTGRMKSYRDNPGLFTSGNIFLLAKLFEVDHTIVMNLIKKQIEANGLPLGEKRPARKISKLK
jgi:hypothetical protein